MAQIRDIGKRTALYERLSKDDEQQGESNSILNQELLRLDATFFTDKRNRHNIISEAGHGANTGRPSYHSFTFIIR